MLIRQTGPNGVVLYTSPMLSAVHVKHAFTTRIGGVSAPPFDSLNLGNPAGDLQDSAANVTQNIERLEIATQLHHHTRKWVHQAHGCLVANAQDEQFHNGSKADAMISGDAGSYLFIRVADCVPILLSTADGKRVAAVHAGWRGIVAGVVPAAVATLAVEANVDLDQIIAAIGPCISHRHFQVGPEVVLEFVRLFGESERWADRHVDLPDAVARQLQASGVALDQIDRTDRCTVRDRDEFFSHRRDRGLTGRMAAVIAPVAS